MAPALIPEGPVKFSKDGKFLKDKVSASIEVAADNLAGMATALLQNLPFPAETVRVASLATRATGDSGAIGFASGAGEVSFQGGGGARAGFGAYTRGGELQADLDPDNNILNGISLPETGVARYVALNWGYDIHAAANGSVALGLTTSVNFGVEGQHAGFMAVIRGFASEPGARDAIQATLDAWMLPAHIQTVDDIHPGTWIVAEVDGQFGVTLGVEFGYDYSWLRNVSLQGLSGDIGLRIAASVAIDVGFDVSGKYLVVVARESLDENDRTVRVRLFKMSRKGWNFALNAKAGVTPAAGEMLPEQLDDFLAGVFGVHGAQLMKDLAKFRFWTDPTVPLEEKFAGFISHYVTMQLQSHAGDEVAKVLEARARIQKLLAKWDDLPHTVSSLVWSEIRKGGEPAAIFEEALRLIAGGTDDELQATVKEALSNVEFFRTPIGKWLEEVTTGRLLSVIANQAEVKKVRAAAQQVVDVLDGKVLQELAAFAEKELHIDQVRDVVDQATLEGLDEWLKVKLTEFIGKNVDLTGVKEVQKTLHFLDTKAGELYQAARAAIDKMWPVSVLATYSSATTKTALFDVNFDFGVNPALAGALTDVIAGNWKNTLLGRPAGVKINQAVLTHGVTRQSHVELTLPHFNTALDKFNASTASMTFAAEDGGIYLYELTADDKITRRRKWQSTASITSKIAVAAGANVNVFRSQTEIAESSTYSYTLLMPRKNLRAPELQQQFAPVVQQYFPQAFTGPGKASFAEWIADLDKLSDQVENNGTFNLGNTTLKLDVAVPGKCVAAWFSAPGEKAPREKYQAMSRNIQRALRKLIPLCYFDEARKYIEQPAAAQILVYSCLPVSSGIQFRDGQLTLDAGKKALFWEYDDPREPALNERHAMIFSSVTKNALRPAMTQARTILEQSAGLSGFAANYAETDAGIDALRTLSYKDNDPNMLILKLLRTESMTIDRAVEAGESLAEFRDHDRSDPEKALKALAEFGAKVTEAFNSQLSDLVGGPLVRALGSAIFVEAARAFDDSLSGVEAVARLDVTILRSSAPATWREDFLAGKTFDRSVVALEQPILNL